MKGAVLGQMVGVIVADNIGVAIDLLDIATAVVNGVLRIGYCQIGIEV